MVGYMSGCSTDIVAQCTPLADYQPVSLGYDRVRFLKGVRIGDTIEIRYTITSADAAQARTNADVSLTNQHGETVAVAIHILKWLKRSPVSLPDIP
jgi:acyl dehydratase